MSQILDAMIDLLHTLATSLPLPLFTVVAAFVEEVIAPIPSPLVMTLAGSLAASAGYAQPYLLWLAVIGAISKTIGSWVVYIIADLGEDFVLGRFGKFLGISHEEVEAFGKHLNQGRRDGLVMFLLRAIPIIPTAPVSLVAGLIKLNLRSYLFSTLLGTLVRNVLYLYFGYTSLQAATSVSEGFESLEGIGYLVLALMMAAGIGYFYYLRKKGAGLAITKRLTEKKSKS
ncbi:MAG: VTT domain-containing protein [Anaerolineales bacterium]|nr:VTT domain-containing protein [Anaerolineales bacterium]